MRFKVSTKGHHDFIDITAQVQSAVNQSGVSDGVAVVFVLGSTAAITAMEYESGIVEDLIKVFEDMAPEAGDYKHHQRWGDHNGAAHIKSALVGPSLTIPIAGNKLLLGTWQQIVLIDFDEKPRDRNIVIRAIKSG